jgi:hypothetical protein
MDDYDPGDLYDEYKRRRRRFEQGSDADDAWAAADEDDIPDESVDIEDLAAGYVDESERPDMAHNTRPPVRYTDSGLGPLPPSAQRATQRRSTPRESRIQKWYDRSQIYTDSPSYHQSQQNPIDRVLSPLNGDAHVPGQGRDPYRQPGVLGHIPLWGIVILVILGLMALFAVIFTFAFVLAWM